MKTKLFFMGLVVFCNTFLTSSQNIVTNNTIKIDSLQQRIDKLPEFNSQKVELLNEYARICFYNKDFQNGLLATRDGRIISEKIDFMPGKIMYHLTLAAFAGKGTNLYRYQNQLAQKLAEDYNLSSYYNPVISPEGYPFEGSQDMIDNLMPVLQHFKDIGDKEIQLNIMGMIIDSLYRTEQYEVLQSMINESLAMYKDRGELFPAIQLYGFKRYLIGSKRIKGDADIILKELLNLISSITDDNILANAYYQLGTYAQFTDKNMSAAVEYYLTAIKYVKKMDKPDWLITMYERVSLIYENLNIWSKRTEYILKIIDLKKKHAPKDDLYLEYQRALWCMYQLKKYDPAWAYMDTLRIDYNTKHKKELDALNYTLEGQILMDQGKYNEAIPILTNAYDTYVEIDTLWAPPHEAIHIADCYIKLGDFKSALKYGRISEDWHLKYPDRERNALETSSRLAKIYNGLGKKEAAYVQLFKYHELIESQSASKSASFIMDVEMRNIIEHSQEQIDLLEKDQFVKEQKNKTQRLWILSITGALLSTLLILFILYRNNKSKQKANTLLNLQKEEVQNTLEQLKQTQSQLIQSEKMASLGELTAGIAHEIQNPLNFVNNFSEVSNELIDDMHEELDKGDIEEAKAISSDLKLNLEKINHHGKRADGIVKGMLQHSRTSNGNKEPTNINTLTDEYLRLAYHGLRAKDKSFNATLETDYDASVGTINIIPQDMGRVILNLITNAFYAINDKNIQLKNKSADIAYAPTVWVSTKKENGNILISVKDNGNGIPQKVIDKIFQPFFTTKPTGAGTGLGLSMSYDIVQAHGGELQVVTTEGKGSKFIITLPII